MRTTQLILLSRPIVRLYCRRWSYIASSDLLQSSLSCDAAFSIPTNIPHRCCSLVSDDQDMGDCTAARIQIAAGTNSALCSKMSCETRKEAFDFAYRLTLALTATADAPLVHRGEYVVPLLPQTKACTSSFPATPGVDHVRDACQERRNVVVPI